MKDFFKTYFVEFFSIMAWLTLLGYVTYCTAMDIKTDSVRDAWNIMILIAGFIWGNAAKQNKKTGETGSTTATFEATVTTEPKEEESKEETK